MKKILFFSFLAVAALVSCQKDEEISSVERQFPVMTREIQTDDNFLKFDSFESLEKVVDAIGQNSTSATTRSAFNFDALDSIVSLQRPGGFKSISALKEEQEYNHRLCDSDDMTTDEYRVCAAERLLPDPLLTNLMDTTLRIKIADTIYVVTNYGTFIGTSIERIRQAYEDFDPVIAEKLETGEGKMLNKYVGFINTFGPNSSAILSEEVDNEGEDENFEMSEDSVITRSVSESANLHADYNVKSYKWKSSSVWQQFLEWLRGKDVKKTRKFDSKHRVAVELFNVNYGFYTSAGIKVKMQKKKKFLGVGYWTSYKPQKLAVGFNHASGILHIKNPCSYSVLQPTASMYWNKFTGTINNITSSFVYGQYHKMGIVKDWVDDIYCFLPEVTINNNVYPNASLMNQLYNAPINAVVSFLKAQTNRNIYHPIQKKIQSKDPRLAYFVWGQGNVYFTSEKPCVMGVVEYENKDSKSIYFDRSVGIAFGTTSGFHGFTPTAFEIKEIDAFGAAKYNNEWLGVRFYK